MKVSTYELKEILSRSRKNGNTTALIKTGACIIARDSNHADIIRSQAKSMGMEVVAAPLTGKRSSWFLLKGAALFDNHTIELIVGELEWTAGELGHMYDSVHRLESANNVLRNACYRLEEEQARIKNNRWYKLLKKLNLI